VLLAVLSRAFFASANDNWETPQELFDVLDQEFSFTLDVCADSRNFKCDRYYDRRENGLLQDWAGEVCWMNPPYSRVAAWVEKACLASTKGALVAGLVPARTDTRWWADHVMRAAEIRLIVGRLRFGNAQNNAPFPSAVVVFDGRSKRAQGPRVYSWNWRKARERRGDG